MGSWRGIKVIGMDWPSVYSELKSWQGAIGSVLGFGALIVGALFNFRLNRRRDEHLRAEEIKSVCCALYAEIVLQRRSLARMANAVANRYYGIGMRDGEDFDKHFVENMMPPPLKLYPALAPKVGILPSHLALEVVQFYARLEEAETWLPRLKEEADRPFSYNVNSVLDPAIDAITGVLPALRLIESLAGISEQEGTLSIIPALEVQELERIRFLDR